MRHVGPSSYAAPMDRGEVRISCNKPGGRSSQPTIARLEKGLDVRTPRWDTLQRIARALGRQLKLKFAAPSDDDGLVEVEQPFRLRRKKGAVATAAAASRTHRSGGSVRRA